MVSGSALQLETCYGVVVLSYLLSAKTYLSAKLAASSVAAGPCSNSPLTLTCGSSSSHLQQASPAATYPSPPAKCAVTSSEVLQLRSSLPRHVLLEFR